MNIIKSFSYGRRYLGTSIRFLSVDSDIGISDTVFGPYHTVSIGVDKIRMLNEIPDVIINTRN